MVSAGTLQLVVCSTLFHHALYQAFKLVLVRKLFEPLLRRRTGDKTAKFPDGDVGHLSML